MHPYCTHYWSETVYHGILQQLQNLQIPISAQPKWKTTLFWYDLLLFAKS
jgi:hypothetical protein